MVAYVAAIFMLLGIMITSVAVPVTIIQILLPTGKTELFFQAAFLIIGIGMMFFSIYILFWFATFRKILKAFESVMGVPKNATE